jgi:hypothetical protein
MAGYSGTPLPRKLGIGPGHRIAVLGAPAGYASTLGALPDGVDVRHDAAPGAGLDLVHLFAADGAALEAGWDDAAASLHPAGMLWISWPKKSSGVRTDLTEDRIRALGLARGLVDVKVCAVDDTWSALKFVVRLADRPRRGA